MFGLQTEDSTIYDEVTEDQYKDVVKGRLLKDDFIEEDGVDGYVDNGMDDWGEGEEESGDEGPSRKKGMSSTRCYSR
jgi:DNA polymerase alpha subunit A